MRARIRGWAAVITVLLVSSAGMPALAADDPTPPVDDSESRGDSGPTEPLTIEPWSEPLPFPDQPATRALVPPVWNLPFEAGQRWSAGGPHRDSDGVAWGALDFSPGSSANKRIVAIAEGRVYRVVCPAGWFLGIDHGGGWRSEYYHLANAQAQLIGQWVPAGTYLGEAASTLPCGGSSNGPHVHLSILYGDPPQPGTGLRPYYPVDGMRFGNYVVRSGAAVHQGTWQTLTGATVFTNWGCCLTSTTAAPQRFIATPAPTVSGSATVGGVLSAAVPSWQPSASFTYQWRRDGAAISGATSTSYAVTKDDRGAQLSFSVTGARSGFWRVSQTSAAVRIPTPITRIAGRDRYETAALASAAAFPAQIDTVYLATGGTFPDALAAASAARASSPVLLTGTDAIPQVVVSELTRLSPRRIVIVGGKGSISTQVMARARTLASVVERRGGADRYATAAELSAATFAPGVPVVYLATGENFPDALSAAGPAGAAGGPVLLARGTELPEATRAELRRLRTARLVVVGGPATVSDAVMAEAGSSAGVTPERQAGADRYATSVLIARASSPAPVDALFIATGERFPDALAGAAAAAATGAPLLLTPQNRLMGSTADLVSELAPMRVFVLGGTAAVSEPVARAIAARAR